MGKHPCFEKIAMDNPGEQLKGADVNFALVKANKDPTYHFKHGFNRVAYMKNVAVYGCVYDPITRCSDVKVGDRSTLLPRQLESRDLSQTVKKNFEKCKGRSTTGAGDAFLYLTSADAQLPSPELPYKEVQRTTKMAEVIELAQKSPRHRLLSQCTKNLWFPWCPINGLGGDLLFRTKECVTATTVLSVDRVMQDMDIAGDSVWENKDSIDKHLVQLDADCMVQVAAQIEEQLHRSNYEEIPRSLHCYGVALNLSQLMLLITRFEVNFDKRETTSCVVLKDNLKPETIDHVVNFALYN